MYGYVCAVFMKLFGLSLTVARIPAVLSGMAVWLFGTFIFREFFSKKFTVLGSFLIAVLPCFIMQSRLGLDCLLFLGVSTAAIYFLLLAVRKKDGSFMEYRELYWESVCIPMRSVIWLFRFFFC